MLHAFYMVEVAIWYTYENSSLFANIKNY